MSRSVLLSVRPRFARALLGGTKTVEIRRRFPDVTAGTTVVIYSSTPDKAVLGTMRSAGLDRSTPAQIWRDYSTVMDLTRTQLTEYLHGASECSVLKLDRPHPWDRPVPLTHLRQILQLEPAQSFRYLSHRQLVLLTELGTTQHPHPALTETTTTRDVLALA